MCNYLSGIRAWHLVEGQCWLGGDRLAHVVAGVNHLAPPLSRRPLRDGVTLKMLNILCESCDSEDPFDVCVLGCALCAFWTQSRLGELLPTSSQISNQPSIPLRTDLGLPSSVNGSRMLHYPRTKTSQVWGTDSVVTCQLLPADAITGLDLHLSVNASDNSVPLFAFSSSQGFKCLTKKEILVRCNKIWGDHDLKRVTGHSFRIGGTTHLLQSGVNPEVVKSMGRWSSDLFLRYWHGADTIVPLHTEMVNQKKLDFIRIDACRSVGAPHSCSVAAELLG